MMITTERFRIKRCRSIYIYGIAQTQEERELVIKEGKEILDVKDVIASILLADDLRIKKN